MFASPSVAAAAVRTRVSVPLDAPVHSMRSVSNHLRTQPGRRYGQLESVSGGVEIAPWAIVGGADTTSGHIHVHEEAAVGPVRSISGNVVVGNKAWIRSAKTVSGHITLGRDVQVEEGVKSTSGTIKTGHGCRIQGDVNSVSGDIALHATEVEGNIHVVSSDLTVAADSKVSGGIHLPRTTSSSFHLPRIVIGAHARVEGELVFESPVELYVHTTAQTGTIRGASRIVYSTPHPPQSQRLPMPPLVTFDPGVQSVQWGPLMIGGSITIGNIGCNSGNSGNTYVGGWGNARR